MSWWYRPVPSLAGGREGGGGAIAAGTAGPGTSLCDATLAAVTVAAAFSGFATVSDAVTVAVTVAAALTGFDSVSAVAPLAVMTAAAVSKSCGTDVPPKPDHTGPGANGWPPGTPGAAGNHAAGYSGTGVPPALMTASDALAAAVTVVAAFSGFLVVSSAPPPPLPVPPPSPRFP